MLRAVYLTMGLRREYSVTSVRPDDVLNWTSFYANIKFVLSVSGLEI